MTTSEIEGTLGYVQAMFVMMFWNAPYNGWLMEPHIANEKVTTVQVSSLKDCQKQGQEYFIGTFGTSLPEQAWFRCLNHCKGVNKGTFHEHINTKNIVCSENIPFYPRFN